MQARHCRARARPCCAASVCSGLCSRGEQLMACAFALSCSIGTWLFHGLLRRWQVRRSRKGLVKEVCQKTLPEHCACVHAERTWPGPWVSHARCIQSCNFCIA